MVSRRTWVPSPNLVAAAILLLLLAFALAVGEGGGRELDRRSGRQAVAAATPSR